MDTFRELSGSFTILQEHDKSIVSKGTCIKSSDSNKINVIKKEILTFNKSDDLQEVKILKLLKGVDNIVQFLYITSSKGIVSIFFEQQEDTVDLFDYSVDNEIQIENIIYIFLQLIKTVNVLQKKYRLFLYDLKFENMLINIKNFKLTLIDFDAAFQYPLTSSYKYQYSLDKDFFIFEHDFFLYTEPYIPPEMVPTLLSMEHNNSLENNMSYTKKSFDWSHGTRKVYPKYYSQWQIGILLYELIENIQLFYGNSYQILAKIKLFNFSFLKFYKLKNYPDLIKILEKILYVEPIERISLTSLYDLLNDFYISNAFDIKLNKK